MKLAVTAAIYVSNKEHKKYLDITTKSIMSADHHIVWLPCENYVNQGFAPLSYVFTNQPDEVKALNPPGQQSVAQAWNMGIEAGSSLGCDYILVLNTDIVLKSNAIDRLVNFAQTHQEAVLWTMTECQDLTSIEGCMENGSFEERPNFSCFMVKSDFFSHVGKFDENFAPAYCEDGDMHARLTLAGLKAYGYGGAKFYHYGSQTLKSDKDLTNTNARTYPRCQLYFLEKWGHRMVDDVEEMRRVYFKHPYNSRGKPLSYWRQPPHVGLRARMPLSVQYRLVLFLNWAKRAKGKLK
ncbi:MAG: hypothetical protein M1167_03215 [Chloroflexi bacterium]|nr:hypothetical protein [Chloroflexota bacterium]